MREIFATIAAWVHALLPEWVRLPSLTFSLPHWAYWLGLLAFPLIAMYLVQRSEEERTQKPVSVAVAYLLWFWSGFVGLHRFYVRAPVLGIVYIGLFLLVLYANVQGTLARNYASEVANELRVAKFMVKRIQKDVDRGRSGAAPKLEAATKNTERAQRKVDAADLVLDQWRALAGGFFATIVILLAYDAFKIPSLVRRCLARETDARPVQEFEVMERGAKADERALITNPAIRFIEALSGWAGNFVAYWSVIAVFVYYYEVIARYVFNSPTNWAHESMFLMFGMQYLLSGAYAYREDAHVRVDVIYAKFSTRTRAIIDIVTSFFFLVFTITLMLTGYLFASDAVDVWEVSFTEWAIEYWPVKITFVIGALLLLLQGLAKLMRDVIYVFWQEAQ